MSVRVSPTEKIRARIGALSGEERELGEVIEDVARLGAQLHRARNVLAKVLAQAQEEIHDAYWAIFGTAALTAAGIAPGQQPVTAAQARTDAFARTYATLYPAGRRWASLTVANRALEKVKCWLGVADCGPKPADFFGVGLDGESRWPLDLVNGGLAAGALVPWLSWLGKTAPRSRCAA